MTAEEITQCRSGREGRSAGARLRQSLMRWVAIAGDLHGVFPAWGPAREPTELIEFAQSGSEGLPAYNQGWLVRVTGAVGEWRSVSRAGCFV